LTQIRGKAQFSLAVKTYFVKLVTKVPKRSAQKVVLLQKKLGRAPIAVRVGFSRVMRTNNEPAPASPPLKTISGWMHTHPAHMAALGSFS
jgi:hypothetical protein